VAAAITDGLGDDPSPAITVKKEAALGTVPGDAVVPAISDLRDRFIALAGMSNSAVAAKSCL
jgi:hypothetical protein